jgi:hypothetical protein
MTPLPSCPARLPDRFRLTVTGDTGTHAPPHDRATHAPWSASDVQEVRP